MNKKRELPPYPGPIEYFGDGKARCGSASGSVSAVNFFAAQARYHAAAARLRLAVDLLNSVECGSCAWNESKDEAIAAIGEIPE